MESVCIAVYEEVKARYGENKSPVICKPEDILQIKAVAKLSCATQESVVCVTVDGCHRAIRTRTITTGLVNHSLIHPREVFRPAIADNAVAIILIHNHPSGNLEPSTSDIKITEQIKQAGDIIGISLLDHVIVGKPGIVSMKSLGYI